jgi:Protein of unknown function (DUF3142)
MLSSSSCSSSVFAVCPPTGRPRAASEGRFSASAALGLAIAIPFLVSCHQSTSTAAEHLRQRGYLWQRSWNPAVTVALAEAEKRLDGVVILGGEIIWTDSEPQTILATIDWESARSSRKAVAIALRVAPYAGPFTENNTAIRQITDATRSLLATARTHQVELTEFQLDFDCAQKKLSGYHTWLRALRPFIRPTRFVITTLPAWLDEPEFAALVHDVDGYVLQVHSVPTTAETGRAALCDTGLARKWVDKANRLKLPFSVALPTYRCLAGYDSTGKLLSVAMDSVEPSWPPGTRVLEFGTDADEIASLVKDWQVKRPSELKELLWYRIPVATDARNWRWPTLSAVMNGRTPTHQLEVSQQGDNPIDLSITNTGEAAEQGYIVVTVNWSGASLVAWDALPGWTVRAEKERATFKSVRGPHSQLPPGSRRSIGWLRYDQVTTIRSEAEEFSESHL